MNIPRCTTGTPTGDLLEPAGRTTLDRPIRNDIVLAPVSEILFDRTRVAEGAIDVGFFGHVVLQFMGKLSKSNCVDALSKSPNPRLGDWGTGGLGVGSSNLPATTNKSKTWEETNSVILFISSECKS